MSKLSVMDNDSKNVIDDNYVDNLLRELNSDHHFTIDELRDMYKEFVVDNEFIPFEPSEQQFKFIMSFDLELGFGGSVGGGKSVALLMAALLFVKHPLYRAIIFRKNVEDFKEAGSVYQDLIEWLTPHIEAGVVSHNKSDRIFYFPSGAFIRFGHMSDEKAVKKYQGSVYNFYGFDEATHFSEDQYLYPFSRLRKDKNLAIPFRVRSATNPGGPGHDWYKNRFIDGDKKFIRSSLDDNPFIDTEDYKKNLDNLSGVLKAQLLNGDWDVVPDGEMFKRENFRLIDFIKVKERRKVRFWDLAGTEVSSKNKDPDYTVGALVSIDVDGFVYVEDIIRVRVSTYEVEKLVLKTAANDGRDVAIRMEQEPGQSGKKVINDYSRKLAGYDFRGERSTGTKTVRATPFSSYVESGNVFIVKGSFNYNELLNEMVAFPFGGHDDQVDAVSGGYNYLTDNLGRATKVSVGSSVKRKSKRRR